jgi:hypothetical protein
MNQSDFDAWLAEIDLADNRDTLKDIESKIQDWYDHHGSAQEYHQYIKLSVAITHQQRKLAGVSLDDIANTAKTMMIPREYLGYPPKEKP